MDQPGYGVWGPGSLQTHLDAGRPLWGALTSAAGQECRLHTSSPQEELSKYVCEFMEDHIQENLPVSWSHCLSTFLPLPTGLSCPWGCCVCTELPGVRDEEGVPEISGGAALKASFSQLSARWPEPWTQLPALSPLSLVLGSEADHLQAGTSKHQGSFFEGTEGPGPVSGRSPLFCGAVGLKAGSSGWPELGF